MITIGVQDAALVRAVNALQGHLQDLTQPMRDVGQALEGQVSQRFMSMTDPNGEAWESLSKATLAQRAKNGTTGNTLDEHGTMLQSLSWQSNAKTATVGFGQPYAAYHEWGTKRMPRRGLLMANPDVGTLGADDLELVLDVLADYLSGASIA